METLTETHTSGSPVAGAMETVFAETNAKFKMACRQLILLNNLILTLQARCDRAAQSNQRSFRYSIRLRMITIEGLRNTLHEYASSLADKLDYLEHQIAMQSQDSDLV